MCVCSYVRKYNVYVCMCSVFVFGHVHVMYYKLSVCACTIYCTCTCICVFYSTQACMHIVSFVSFLGTPLPLPRFLKLFLYLLVSVTMSWRISSSTSCSKKWTGWGSSGRSSCGPGEPKNGGAATASSLSGVVANHGIDDVAVLVLPPPSSPSPPPPPPSPPPLVCSCARRSLTYTVFLLSLPCAYCKL